MGLLIFIVGSQPEWFGITESPVIGYLQISVFIGGLAVMCVGVAFSLNAFWQGTQKTIVAEIGLRLLATGFVVSAISAFADMVGLGTRPQPYLPFFGYWQSRGLLIGQGMIIISILMIFPYRLWMGKKKE